ncbi:MAG TPA: (4Fe-4S)-binding protein [Bellilinea sp.]|nr:(4Fe-4S)-binding protein [Bellilinea sp.]
MNNPAEKKVEDRKRPGVERVYQNDQIAVFWEPRLCIHAGNCFHGLPQVFDPNTRPWVNVNSAAADRIARVVTTCPTGALHYERLDGGEQEAAPVETVIDVQPNGPLFVR